MRLVSAIFGRHGADAEVARGDAAEQRAMAEKMLKRRWARGTRRNRSTFVKASGTKMISGYAARVYDMMQDWREEVRAAGLPPMRN